MKKAILALLMLVGVGFADINASAQPELAKEKNDISCAQECDTQKDDCLDHCSHGSLEPNCPERCNFYYEQCQTSCDN